MEAPWLRRQLVVIGTRIRFVWGTLRRLVLWLAPALAPDPETDVESDPQGMKMLNTERSVKIGRTGC